MLAVSRPALPSPFSVRRGPAAIWAPRTILSGPQRLPVPVASAFEQRHATHAALAGGEASRPLEQVSQLQTLVVASAEAPQQEAPWWKRWLPKVISFAAVLGLAASLALASPGAALAKGSGGRAGGRVSSSARSSSYSSKSSSSHSSSSFGFGGSSYSSSSSSSLSRASRLAPSTSSSTTIVVQPSYRFGIPFGGSYYPSVGVSSDVPVGVNSSYSAMDSFFDTLGTLLVISVFLFVLFGPAIEAAMNSSGSSSSSSTYAPPLTFVTLQVGILAVDEVLQPALAEVADGADTNSARGLQQLLRDACLVMLRRPEYCAYGRLAVRTGLDERKADAAFDSASLEERAKFREETRVNVGGRKRNKAGNSRSKLGARAGEAEVPHEVVVVTLLVTATGDVASRLPRNVRNSADAAQALRALAALAPGDIHGVELLWTPEAEGDSLSKEELLTDYPTLAPLV